MKKSLGIAAAVTASAGLALTANASAADWVYYGWNASPNFGVGRVQQDGTAVDDSLATGTGNVSAVAVSDGQIFFVNPAGGPIMRVPVSGGAPTTLLAAACSSAAGASVLAPSSLATNGQHLYYVCQQSGASVAAQTRYLARVGLDGSGANETFVTLTGTLASRVAVTSSYAYLGGGANGLTRVALAPGSPVEAGPSGTIRGLAVNSTHLFWGTPSSIGRSALDFSGANASFIPGQSPANSSLAATDTYLFWDLAGGAIARSGVDGQGINANFLPASARSNVSGGIAISRTPGGSSGGGATPAPAPDTTPTGVTTVASLVRTATVTNTPQSNRAGCSQVTVPLQLQDTGQYTFIFEGAAGQTLASVEMQNGKRVVQQKGSRLGKRVLKKASTAPVVSMTEANAKLVVNALIKKAQAKNLRLRVIHKATNGTLTENVFNT